METVVHNSHYGDNKINNFDCIRMKHLIVNIQSLLDNSKLLYNVLKILQNNKDITIEKNYTSNREILIGLTIDYRHLENWQSFRENAEPLQIFHFAFSSIGFTCWSIYSCSTAGLQKDS